MTLRHRLYLILEQGAPHDALTWAVNAGLILTIVASLLATICESVPHLARRYSLSFQLVQLTVATIFCLEYLTRVWTAEEHAPWRRSRRAQSSLTSLEPYRTHFGGRL
jgi:voltage-gated potassium channel